MKVKWTYQALFPYCNSSKSSGGGEGQNYNGQILSSLSKVLFRTALLYRADISQAQKNAIFLFLWIHCQKTMSTVLISNPYLRTGYYYFLNLTPAAHFYCYFTPFLDNEKNRIHSFFISLCLPTTVHLTERNMISPLRSFVLALYFIWLYWICLLE